MTTHSTDTDCRGRTRPAARPDQILLSGRQADAQYGVPYRTLYDLHRQGALPAVRIGRRLWWRRTDIDAYLASHIEVPVGADQTR